MDLLINPYVSSDFIFYKDSKVNFINLYFGFLKQNGVIDFEDPLYQLFLNKHKTIFLDKLNSCLIEINGDECIKKDTVTINNVEFIKKKTDGFFSLFKYDVFLNEQVILSNKTSTVLKLSDSLFKNTGSYSLTLKLFFNEFQKEYFHEVSFKLLIVEPIYSFKFLNAGNICSIFANGYEITLSPGKTIGTLLVDSISRIDPSAKISKIIYKSSDKIESYKTLTIGSEIPFMSEDSSGNIIFNSNIGLSLFFYHYFDPDVDNPSKIGTISLNPISDSVKVLPHLFYDCSSDVNSASVSVINDMSRLFTKKTLNGTPLFFYFVIKGEISGDINLIDNDFSDTEYLLESLDDVTHFVYFNPEKDKTYSFLMNGFYYNKDYFPISSSHYDAYTVNKSLTLGDIYFDKAIFLHPTEKYVNVRFYLNNGKTLLANNVPVASVTYDNLPDGIGNTLSDFKSLTSLHFMVESKIQKIDAFSLDGEPLYNLNVLNFFSSHSYSNGSTQVYKKELEAVYSAKPSVEYVFDNSLVKDLTIGKKYAIENGEFVEYNDGYICFSEISYDSFFFYDSLEDLKETSKTGIFSYVLKKKHTPEVLSFFEKNFKTPNIPLKRM